MNNQTFTYSVRTTLLITIVWEIIFWIFTVLVLSLLGIFDPVTKGSQIGFKYPQTFWLFLLMIPIAFFFLHNLYAINKLGGSSSPTLRKFILQPVSTVNNFLRFFFFRNAFALLIFAMAQPVYQAKKVAGTIESMELVICLDVSNSMNTKDIDPELTRLDVAKRALSELVNNLHGEKIGICVFAGSAYVQLPLTTDYFAAKMFVNDIETDMISSQGTNIAEAIHTSRLMFSKEKTSKAIILVTDGENHEEDPTAELKSLKTDGIELSILGIGTLQGGLVPINPDRPELGYKTGATGQKVISKINPDLIRSLASKSGGSATISSDPFPDIYELLTQINHLKRTKVRDLEFEVKENHYQIPLFAALIFWLLFLLWSKGLFGLRNKWIA